MRSFEVFLALSLRMKSTAVKLVHSISNIFPWLSATTG